MGDLSKETLIRGAILVAIAALGLFYCFVLMLARAPQVSGEYRLFFFEKSLARWPSAEALAYRIGEPILFTAAPDARIGRGFENRNEGGLWTVGTQANIVLYPDGPAADTPHRVRIELANTFLSEIHKTQRVTLSVNGSEITTWQVAERGETTLTAPLPAELLVPGEPVHLKLSLRDAHSPKEAGRSNDARLLALFVRSITIEAI